MIRRPPRSTLSLHDALPICGLGDSPEAKSPRGMRTVIDRRDLRQLRREVWDGDVRPIGPDRKSTRLNSSHANISYAVFCLKKKKTAQLTLSLFSLHTFTLA